MGGNSVQCTDETVLLEIINKMLLGEVYFLSSLIEKGGSISSCCRRLLESETIMDGNVEIEPT